MGEHNSRADRLPSVDLEMAIRVNQSIGPRLVINSNLGSRAKRRQWSFVRDQSRFFPLPRRPRRGSNMSASIRSPLEPRARLLLD